MKKADMQKAMDAGTPVAVGRGYGDEYDARKAVIVALGQERKVHTGARWDLAGHFVKDGVRVQWVRSAGSIGRADRTVVGPREVVDTWEEYERKRAEIDAREARVREERANRSQRAASALEQLRQRGHRGHLHFDRGDHLWGVTLDLASAERLVEELTGVEVLHSELPPLLGEISRARAGILAKRDDFPAPVKHTDGGEPLWLKADVERYQRDRMAKQQPPKEART